MFAYQNAPAGTVLLSAGLGGARSFWQPQFNRLKERYQVILYDHRGTGEARDRLPDPYSIGDMAEDVLEILDAHAVSACHIVGHALGGLIGLQMALDHRERVRSLVVVNGWAKLDSHTKRCFEVRLDLLRHVGPEAYIHAQPIFLFPGPWMSEHAERLQREHAHAVENFQGTETLSRRVAALQAFDITKRLTEITCPVLVAASRDDILVPWTASKYLADNLPNARLWLVPEGGHGFTITVPGPFNTELRSFLDSL